jgi:hypothetical protein
MNQALYAHMNNKRKMKKKIKYLETVIARKIESIKSYIKKKKYAT